MRLIEVVILAGSHCISPLQGGDGVTEVVKVPCAVMVRHDAATNLVQIVPSAGAADPHVIAALVKPETAPSAAMADAPEGVSAKGDRAMPEDEGDGGEVIPIAAPSFKPAGGAASDEPNDKAPSRVKGTAQPRDKAAATRKLADRCGSYRAEWYTSKNGYKRYRCVRPG